MKLKKSKLKKQFQETVEQSAKMVSELPDKGLETIVQRALEKARLHQKTIKKSFGDLYVLYRFVKAWARREYKLTSHWPITWALAAIVYFLNPFDMVTDYLPMVGFIDDGFILGYVVHTFKKELNEFRLWENKN